MAKTDLGKFIIPRKLSNTDENQEMGNAAFDTTDYIWLPFDSEIEDLSSRQRQTTATDFSVANGSSIWCSDEAPTGKKGPTSFWLRSAYSNYETYYVDEDGDRNFIYVKRSKVGVRPALHLNLPSIISAQSASRDFGKLGVVKDTDGNVLYHTIEFGEYPNHRAKNSDELENLYQNWIGRLKETGKFYSGYLADDDKPAKHEEYEYRGERYVRVKINRFEGGNFYEDGTMVPDSGTYEWFKVEPIVWEIRNWDELPRSINPSGNNSAKVLDIQTAEVIMGGIPFYPNDRDENISFWQNSCVRGFLNGINVSNIKTNGNKEYQAPNGGDWTGAGFLQQAFREQELNTVLSAEQEQGLAQEQSFGRKSRLEKLNPDKTASDSRRRMTDTEMIKTWIDAGQSVLLRGPSGIGKTERLKKLYPDLIYIKLTNNMFPEKVVGSMNLQTGQAIPPDFAKQALLACATDEERRLILENIQNLYELADTIYERSKSSEGKTVILLDELLNVKPAVQSLVYTLVLNKIVETGKGLKLPANTVVVATGNQKKYSSVAEDLAEPLEKRFDHILDMEPKVSEWLFEHAIPNNIHPSVIGYIFSKYHENRRSEKIENMPYFYEEPEVGESHLDRNGCRGRTNDPRGWTSISNTLYAFEEDMMKGKFEGIDVEALLAASIGSKLRDEWAQEFFDFYNNPTLTVEEVVEKRYGQQDLPRDINENFAYLASLLTANETQVASCRDFIKQHCGPEYLTVYDLYWAGNDDNRILMVAEMQDMEGRMTAAQAYDGIDKKIDANRRDDDKELLHF